ncbi:response regulator [Candidatus Fermentibacteria bacterium]|nr:response regulator [Candidatus Fermentibacteria bacterium]
MTSARILVVEDDAIVAAHLERVLAQMGYEVTRLVATGEDAVAAAGADRPDVVLMDVRLRGEMDGIRAAEEIRAGYGLPIIYLTAYADEPLIQKAKRTEPYGYLAKPVRDKELHASIEMALYKHATDRKLKHLSDVLRAVRDVNKLITRERDRFRMMAGACRILEHTRGYVLVVVNLVSEGGSPTVVVGEGAPELAAALLRMSADDLMQTPCMRSIRQGKMEVCDCSEAVQTESAWGRAAAAQGVCAIASIPMRYEEKTYGALCVYGDRQDAFGPGEMDLLEELADDLAFAVKGLADQEARLAAELQLQASEERYRELVENLNEVIISLDADSRIAFVSPAATAILGYAPAEMVGRPYQDFIHADDLSPVRAAFQDLLRGELSPSEYRMITKSGAVRWVRSSSRPVVEDGRITGIQGLISDITERTVLETQLRRAQKLEAFGQLAGGVAHDFNNVLQTIVGYLSLAMRSLNPAHESYDDLKEIERATERAAALTRQLLAFGRRQVLDLRVQNLSDVVAGMLKMMQRALGEHIVLNLHARPSTPTVRIDAGQIEQVLLNLALNARDAMPGGGQLDIGTDIIHLERDHVAAHPEATAGTYAVLRVSDTGSGMSEEVKAHVFEPFFTTKAEGTGSGLGLAMVHGIVKQHEGFCEIESEPGRGTSVAIYLPEAAEPASQEEARIEVPKPAGGTEVILMAEDEGAIRALNARILSSAGYRVLQAANGEEAMKVFDDHGGGVDLALLDVVMPRAGGVAVLQHVRAHRPGLPVVFSSGYSDDVSQTRLVQEQGLALLRKPFTPNELLLAVRAALDSARGTS